MTVMSAAPITDYRAKIRSFPLNIGIAALYAFAFVWAYVGFLNYYFDYAGFYLYPRPALMTWWSMLIAVLPVFLYRGVHGVSSVIGVYVYSLLYVPIIVTFPFASARPGQEIIIIQLTFVAGMCLVFLADTLPLRNPLYLRLRINMPPIALLLTILSTIYVLYTYRGNLSFASFGSADTYIHRFETEHLGQGLVIRYLSTWLTNVFVPICLAYGLVTRKLTYYVVGTAACVVMYLAASAKIIILFPAVYLGFYVMFKRGRLKSLFPVMIGGLGVSMATLSVLARLGTTLFLIGSIVIYRTIGNSGQITVEYDDFFATHPVTEWSHIHLVNSLTHAYPYGENSVGQAVGQYYTSLEMDANANFWATDGIAAMGLAGVAIVSVACVLVLILMDSITRDYSIMFVTLCFTPFTVVMTQTSLFSALWSGGGMFLLAFFLFNRRDPALIRERLPAAAVWPA